MSQVPSAPATDALSRPVETHPVPARTSPADRTTSPLWSRVLWGVGIVGGLAIAAVLGTAMLSDSEAASTTTQAGSLSVSTMRIEPESTYTVPVRFIGRVEPARESELGFELAGLVTEIMVDEGAVVEPDQIIARLDTAKLIARRAEVVARLRAAEATLRELKKGPRDEEIRSQRAEVSRLEATYRQASATAERDRDLFRTNSISRQKYDDTRFAQEAAKAAYDTAKARLDELLAGTRQEKIDAQAALVQQTKAERDSIDVDVAKSSLRAPFGGVVGKRHLDEGQVIMAGAPVLELLEMTKPRARIGVDVRTAAGLNVGDTHDLHIGEAIRTATVFGIRRDLDPRTRSVEVLFAFPEEKTDSLDRSRRLRRGELVRFEVGREITESGFWLPISALTENSRGLWSCYIAQPRSEADPEPNGLPDDATHIVRRIEVELLHAKTERVYARGPLTPEMLVITAGSHRLVPGQGVVLKTD